VDFPVYLQVASWRVHPHAPFELLAYFVGFQIYLWRRRRHGDVIGGHARWWLVAGAIVGAAIGSRVLAFLEDPVRAFAHLGDPASLLGGKTVVGALLGGLLAVELVKRALGITRRTGDLFAVPLAVGIAIGRLGCFFTGPADLTWGLPTSTPWGIEAGDGIARHPAPLYESLFLGGFAVLLARWSARPHPDGWLFRAFMIGYLGFRLLVDALKPEVSIALGLGTIQWACLIGLIYYVVAWRVLPADGGAAVMQPSRR